jgi:hypothetical protein
MIFVNNMFYITLIIVIIGIIYNIIIIITITNEI